MTESLQETDSPPQAAVHSDDWWIRLLPMIILVFVTVAVFWPVLGHQFLAYDDSVKGKRPGILVVHEWWGHNKHAQNRARKLAELGYTAFALDMYGSGKLAEHPKKAGEFMNAAFKNWDASKEKFREAKKIL